MTKQNIPYDQKIALRDLFKSKKSSIGVFVKEHILTDAKLHAKRMLLSRYIKLPDTKIKQRRNCNNSLKIVVRMWFAEPRDSYDFEAFQVWPKPIHPEYIWVKKRFNDYSRPIRLAMQKIEFVPISPSTQHRQSEDSITDMINEILAYAPSQNIETQEDEDTDKVSVNSYSEDEKDPMSEVQVTPNNLNNRSPFPLWQYSVQSFPVGTLPVAQPDNLVPSGSEKEITAHAPTQYHHSTQNSIATAAQAQDGSTGRDVVMATDEGTQDADVPPPNLHVGSSELFLNGSISDVSTRDLDGYLKGDFDEDSKLIFSTLVHNGFNFTIINGDGACLVSSIVVSLGKQPTEAEVKELKRKVFQVVKNLGLKDTVRNNYNRFETVGSLGDDASKPLKDWAGFTTKFYRHSAFYPQALYPYMEHEIKATILVFDVDCKHQKIGLLAGFLHDMYEPADEERHFILVMYTSGDYGHFNIFTLQQGRRSIGRFQYKEMPDQLKAMLVNEALANEAVVKLFKRIAQLN